MPSISIDPKIEAKANRCIFGKKCLCGETDHMCRVERQVMGNGLFLLDQRGENCPYFMEFGFSMMCHCPIRIELYQKHNM